MLKTIVILHGWGGEVKNWQPVVKKLTKAGFKVYIPRFPVDKIRDTADFAEWVNNQTKRLPKFYLVGHSFGGQVALQFINNYPGRVKKLILIGSAGIRRQSLKSRLLLPLAKLLKNLIGDTGKHFFYRLIGETDYINANSAMKESLKLILREDQKENMKKINTPTLLIWGRHDTYTPLSDGKLMNQLIKNSQLIIFPDGKHGLHLTHAGQLAEKTLWFTHSK